MREKPARRRSGVMIGSLAIGAAILIVFGSASQIGIRWSELVYVPVQLSAIALLLFLHVEQVSRRWPTRAMTIVQWRAPSARELLALSLGSVLVGFGVLRVLANAGYLIYAFDDPSGAGVLKGADTSSVWLFVGFAGPLVEEIAFRGWMQRGIQEMLGPWPAVLIGAVLFGSLHYWYGEPVYLVVPTILGLMWGLAAWVTRSIWAAVVLHSLWNLGMLLAARVYGDPAKLLTAGSPGQAWLANGALLGSGIMIFALGARLPQRRARHD